MDRCVLYIMESQNGEHENGNGSSNKNKLEYGVSDTPKWHLCILLGFQHFLTMLGTTIAVPLILARPLGVEDNNEVKCQLITTIFFCSGISTLLQTSIGIRLPVVQGAAGSFLPPVIAIFSSIPDINPHLDANIANAANGTADEPPAWLLRLRTAQGATIVASLLQIILGLTGVIGYLTQKIGPITISVTISLVGLNLVSIVAIFASSHWGISFFTMFLIILFSQYLKNLTIPIGQTKGGFKVFMLFPVVLALLTSWILCLILTAAGVFPDNKDAYGYSARTDLRLQVLERAPWFRIPYPGQWGIPIVTISGVLGVCSGILASIIESMGDYFACANICKAKTPPSHALNRGIFIEGIGCMLAGLLGTGNGTTSYTENIAAIGITKVASRRVIQTSAVIMIMLGMLGKFGALFTVIPDPVVGGLFCIMFGLITAVGISNLRHVDLESSRNLLIIGFSLFMGLTIPNWFGGNASILSTGVPALNQIISVLLNTGMFVGGFISFLLDNTIPGSLEERGLLRGKPATDGERDEDIYDIPGFEKLVSNRYFRWLSYCPIFPKSQRPMVVNTEDVYLQEEAQNLTN